MSDKDWNVPAEGLLRAAPNRRIKPVDGLAVTAAIWEEAHEYHRQQQRLHALLSHGAGVLSGLEVIASDPPDSAVYVRPGVAIGPNGQMIVLTEPVRYDFGQAMEGMLYLLLDYGEGRPRAIGNRNVGDEVLYIHDQFRLEAQHALPAGLYVELARVKRLGRTAPILDAPDADHPRPNELDLRFRRKIGLAPQAEISLAVSYVGEMTDMRHGRGANYLARFLSQSGAIGQPVWVDNNVFLDASLRAYTLVYLVGQQAFQLDQDEMTALYNYVRGGGTILYESCRHWNVPAQYSPQGGAGGETGDPPADASFLKLLQSLGFNLQDWNPPAQYSPQGGAGGLPHSGLPPGQALLTDPFLFAAPPAGFETNGTPKLQFGEGVIFSTYDYGCLWQGEQRGRRPTREEIRAALEWGGNIVNYARERRGSRGD